jgi:hypothetical protein
MGRQVLGGRRFRADARETWPRSVIRRPKARRVALLQHHVHAANDWLSLQVSTAPWPVPSSTSAHPLFALLRSWLPAGSQPSARVMLRRLRPVRCHGSRALELRPFTVRQSPWPAHVTAVTAEPSGTTPAPRCCDDAAARFPVPLRRWSTYRYAERDWLSTGGPTLSSEMPPSRVSDSRILPFVKTLLDRVKTSSACPRSARCPDASSVLLCSLCCTTRTGVILSTVG